MINLDFKEHNQHLFSIKDLSNDINIFEKKWDRIFDVFFKHSRYCLFLGDRLNYSDKNLLEIIDFLSVEVFIQTKAMMLFKLKEVVFLNHRLKLSKLWAYYEVPSLILFTDERSQSQIINFVKGGWNYDTIASKIEDLYWINQSIESNVLWFSKGKKTVDISEFYSAVI